MLAKPRLGHGPGVSPAFPSASYDRDAMRTASRSRLSIELSRSVSHVPFELCDGIRPARPLYTC